MYKSSIPEEDIAQDAECLGVTVEQFIDFFSEKKESGMGIKQSISLVIFCRRMVTASWEIVSRIAVKNTHIQTGWNRCGAYWGC